MNGSDASTDDELPLAYRQGNSIEGLLPIIAYVAGDQLGSRLFSDDAGTRIAVIAMTAAAVWALVQRHRRGQGIGWWIPSVAAYLFLRGIAGIIWGEDVFLAIGIGLKLALGLAAIISVAVGKPLAALLSPMVLPFAEAVRAHRLFFVAMRNITLAYGVYQLVSVGFEIWLLANTESGSGFLIIRTLVSTVASFVGFIGAVIYSDRKMRRIPGFVGILAMFEQIGEVLETQRADTRSSRRRSE